MWWIWLILFYHIKEIKIFNKLHTGIYTLSPPTVIDVTLRYNSVLYWIILIIKYANATAKPCFEVIVSLLFIYLWIWPKK